MDTVKKNINIMLCQDELEDKIPRIQKNHPLQKFVFGYCLSK